MQDYFNPSKAYISINQHAGEQARTFGIVNRVAGFEHLRKVLIAALCEAEILEDSKQLRFKARTKIKTTGKDCVLECVVHYDGSPSREQKYVTEIVGVLEHDHGDRYARRGGEYVAQAKRLEYLQTIDGAPRDKSELIDEKEFVDREIRNLRIEIGKARRIAFHEGRRMDARAFDELNWMLGQFSERSQELQRMIGNAKKSSQRALSQCFVDVAHELLAREEFNRILNEAQKR
jgi:hypothetical protein